MHESFRIGELASRTGCDVATIRYYEQAGLLPKPTRSSGNYRLYGADHVARLFFVRHCRSLDMTLDEIRMLLRFRDAPERNCAEVNTLLDAHIGHVAQRIGELTALETQLKQLRRLCTKVQAARDCKILDRLARDTGTKRRASSIDHVHGPHAGKRRRSVGARA
jgi:Cd(II)/Pb(II)-responsive transcriptional regulator